MGEPGVDGVFEQSLKVLLSLQNYKSGEQLAVCMLATYSILASELVAPEKAKQILADGYVCFLESKAGD